MTTKTKINDFSLYIATVNGSGSQSANAILARTLFRMGLPVATKNLFPSNIAGLSTWYSIRVNANGFVGRREKSEIVVAKNVDSVKQDLAALISGGYFIYDQDMKFDPTAGRTDVQYIPIPYRQIITPASDSVKMRKLLTNMVYVGALAHMLGLDVNILKESVRTQFDNKEHVVDLNVRACELGCKFAEEQKWGENFPYRVERIPGGNADKILVDGNSAAALGALVGGCTFLSWYPITPSSSLAENFQAYARHTRDHDSETAPKKYAIVQAEDELSAFNMVIGAGWAGARAMTATSGPGLSLMAEGAGLSYFAEVPTVIWDIQRVGPSTGLPTRTMQGDLRAAAHLSHGDTEHVVLLPRDPAECYEFAQLALDLAEELQTLIIVLSDLDIGMNFYMAKEFQLPTQDFKRGKVLTAEDLNNGAEFARYKDVDGDGICYRTLPGTMHTHAAYFTRGTGHNEKSGYSEDAETFKKLLERLARKMQTATRRVPKPIITPAPSPSEIGMVAFGSSDFVVPEVLDLLGATRPDYMRLRALPFPEEVESFLAAHKKIIIVEQNRDAQMLGLLAAKFPQHAYKFQSILHFDGLPLTAEFVLAEYKKLATRTESPQGGRA